MEVTVNNHVSVTVEHFIYVENEGKMWQMDFIQDSTWGRKQLEINTPTVWWKNVNLFQQTFVFLSSSHKESNYCEASDLRGWWSPPRGRRRQPVRFGSGSLQSDRSRGSSWTLAVRPEWKNLKTTTSTTSQRPDRPDGSRPRFPEGLKLKVQFNVWSMSHYTFVLLLKTKKISDFISVHLTGPFQFPAVNLPLLTGPGRVQPVLDVEDLLVFRASVRLLTDFIIFSNFLLQTRQRTFKVTEPD